MLRRLEVREPVSTLKVDKGLAADCSQVNPMQNGIRSEIGVLELIVTAHSS